MLGTIVRDQHLGCAPEMEEPLQEDPLVHPLHSQLHTPEHLDTDTFSLRRGKEGCVESNPHGADGVDRGLWLDTGVGRCRSGEREKSHGTPERLLWPREFTLSTPGFISVTDSVFFFFFFAMSLLLLLVDISARLGKHEVNPESLGKEVRDVLLEGILMERFWTGWRRSCVWGDLSCRHHSTPARGIILGLGDRGQMPVQSIHG